MKPTVTLCNILDLDRFQRLANRGARPQRLLWASTGTKDPRRSGSSGRGSEPRASGAAYWTLVH